MNRSPLRTLFIGAMGVTVLAGVTLAAAGASERSTTWGQPQSATVRLADLDLATPQGAATLRRRIEVAVNRACDLPHGEQLAQRAQVDACKTVARSSANLQAERLLQNAQSLARGD
jgi:UrcA family protein